MQIRELEGRTGLDRATIRYYEREGLLTPQRQENGYRSYSEEDAGTLLKIKLLRSLGMPLETIRSLQQGDEGLGQALDELIPVLDQKIRDSRISRDICREIQGRGGEYRELDAEYYLKRLERGEEALPSRPTAPVPFQENTPRPYHPVRRLLARGIDLALITGVLRFLLIVVLRVRPFGTVLSWCAYFGGLLLMVPLEALCLSRWGSTPGKWAMGLGVRSCDGDRLSFSRGAERAWSVLRDALGYGIPGLRLWRLRKRYRELRDGEEPEWDMDCEYEYGNWSRGRKAAFAGMLCLVVALGWVSAQDSMKPRYRGDRLTVAQFAANYNFYARTASEEISPGMLLQENGSPYPRQEGVYVLYAGGQPEREDICFDYETEDDILRKISYSNRWTEVFYCDAVPVACETAVCAVFLSQDGADYQDWARFSGDWQEALDEGKTEGTLSWGNMELRWRYTLDNCQIAQNGTACLVLDSEQQASMALQLEIIIQ